MGKLLVASHNRHKLNEIKSVLNREGVEVDLVSLYDLHDHNEIPEDGDTLEANALQKARVVYARHGMNCFADDTGLEVKAIGGAPGVFSARYAGAECDADKNMQKLLSEMKGKSDRSALFRTVVALILDGKEYIFEGIVEGDIMEERSGSQGFGYDPIFRPTGFSKNFAEMSKEEKNRISHRGRAIQALANFLKNKV